MAVPPIRIDINGPDLEKAKRFFKRAVDLGQDPTELLEIMGSTVEASTRRRFDEEKGPGGIPWPKSKRALGLVRGRRGTKQVGKTLTDIGDLESSLRHVVTTPRLEVGFDGLTVSSKNAKSHQFGVNATVQVPAHSRTVTSMFGVPLPEPKVQKVKAHPMKMNIPKREMLGIDADDRRDIKLEWVGALRRLLNGGS